MRFGVRARQLGDIGIHDRHQGIHLFHHGNVRAKGTECGGQLTTDDAAADDAQTGGDFFGVQPNWYYHLSVCGSIV